MVLIQRFLTTFFVVSLMVGCGKGGNSADTILGTSGGTSTTTPAPASSVTPLTISPGTVTLAIGGSQTFTAAGGSGTYSFSILTGGGTINSSTGAYTAPSSSGSTVVQVSDSEGRTANAVVAIATSGALAISPLTQTVVVNATLSYSASGGTGPYTYAKIAGTGTIDSTTGIYTAPSSAGSATIEVTDSTGATASTTVTIVAALAISPTAPSLVVNASQTFTASGGLSPYTYSLPSGSGSLVGAVYTAPSTTGSATVRVTDSLGNISDASVTITTGPAAQIVITGTTGIVSGTCVGYAIVSKDSGGNTVNVTSATTVDLSATGSGHFYSDSGCSSTISSTVIPINNNTKTIYFSDTVAESTTLIGTTTGLGNAYFLAIVSAAPIKKLIHSGQTYLQRNTCSSAFTISSQDNGGAAFPAPSTTVVTLVGTGTTTFYSDSGCSASITTATIAQNATSVSFYMRDTVAETVSLSYTSSGWVTGTGTVTVWASLSISPSSKNLAVNTSQTFSGVGGAPPYTFTVVPGTVSGTVSSTTGSYTAPASTGTSAVEVTDQVGNTATANITVVSDLTVAPTSRTILVGQNFTLTSTCPVSGNNICVSGGVPPYSYAVTTGTGSVGAANGIFVAPGSAESDVVTVTDSDGNTTTLAVTVMPSPVVELLFEENANNWGANSGSTNGNYSRWATNARAYPIFSSNAPSGTSSTHSLSFGDGTGWGGIPDGAVDLVKQGGLRLDFFNNYTLTAPVMGYRQEGPLNWAFGSNPYSAYFADRLTVSIRFLGRILPAVTSNYSVAFASSVGSCRGGNAILASQFINTSLSADSATQSNSCGLTANVSSASTSRTADTMIDNKTELQMNGSDNNITTNIQYSVSWTSSAGGPFPSSTIIGSTYLWAPMPVTELASLTKFTITGWLNNMSNSLDGSVILSWLYSGSGGVELRYRSDGSLQMGINQAATAGGTPRSSSGKVTTSATAAASNWVFFAVTFDSTLGAQQVKYYFGAPGVPATADLSPNYASGAVGATVSELTIGNFNTSSLSSREAGGNVFRGVIDDVRIYDSVLSLSQIQGVQIY